MITIDLENNFFDRRSILDLLKRRVIDLKEGYRQNIAFLGDRFIGKSAILRKFIADLDDDDIIPIYLDLDNKDFDYIFLKFTSSLLYRFSKSKKITEECTDLPLLMESTKRFIPQTIEEIKKIKASLAKGRQNEAYRDMISLPEVFTLESSKFCVIILDEFHHLEELMIANVFQELGKKIMTQKRCIYLLASSCGPAAKKILSEKLSLLFGNFEVVPVGAFDAKTSQEFIASNLKGMRMNESLRNFLVDFTGGHPFYITIICQELLNLAAIHRQGEVFLPLLSQAIENVIFNRWGLLSRHFEFMLNQLEAGRQHGFASKLLIALANDKHKLEDMEKELLAKKSLITPRINRLIELNTIIKNGTFYHFREKLFKYWVKYVFQKRLQAIDGACEHQRRQFKEEVNSLVHNFQMISQKDLSSRLVELLSCFDNESLQLNGRKYKLPLFQQIVPLRDEKGFNMIKAITSDGVWFIIFKEGNLQEQDVNIFLAESKKFPEKPQQRIVVSLCELDANARLKALSEKMWVWSGEELNALLNLYGKPYIVK